MKYIILSLTFLFAVTGCNNGNSQNNSETPDAPAVKEDAVESGNHAVDYISSETDSFKNKTAAEMTETVGFEVNGDDDLQYSGFITLGKAKEKIGKNGSFEFSSPRPENKRGTWEMYTYKGSFSDDKLADTCVTSLLKYTDGVVDYNYSLTAIYNIKGCQGCTIEGVLIPELGAMNDSMGHIENDTPNGYRDAFLLKWKDKAEKMQRKNKKKGKK